MLLPISTLPYVTLTGCSSRKHFLALLPCECYAHGSSGGKLIIFEPCNLACGRIPFIFGLLPGWWLGKCSTSLLLNEHV